MEKADGRAGRRPEASSGSTPARSRRRRSRSTTCSAEQDAPAQACSTSSRRARVKDYFRNAPLLDFMAPTLKVQQIILPNVVDDVNFITRRRRWTAARPATWRSTRRATRSTRSRSRRTRTWRPVSRRQLAAPDRQDRLHGLPRGHGAVGQLPRRGAHAAERRSRRKSGRRSTAGKSRTRGTTRCCRSKMTEASCAKCHKQQVYIPKRRQAQHRLRDLRARRLLRVPQDQGLRHEHARSPGRS